MIEIVAENENLQKNVRQIGTPADEDKIYISDEAYKKIHSEAGLEKRVFVMMGHTEKSGGKYATFIENVIMIRDIQFEQNVPVWSNKVWNSVFEEIKNNSNDSIIVGWTLDLRGYSVEKPSEIERLHREQFGGRHQLFYLLDTLEGEECFFVNRNNHLYKKEGFYIYYRMNESKKIETDEKTETCENDLEETSEIKRYPGGRYRQLLNMEQVGKTVNHEMRGGFGAFLMIGMIAMMVVVIGTGILTNENINPKYNGVVQTMGENVHTMREKGIDVSGKKNKKTTDSDDLKEDDILSTEKTEIIPVEKLSE